MRYELQGDGPDRGSIFVYSDEFGKNTHLEIKATSEGLIVEFWREYDDGNCDYLPVYAATYGEMGDSAGLPDMLEDV